MTHIQCKKLARRRSVLAGIAGSLILAATPLVSAQAQEGLGTADNPVEVRIMANEAFANSWQTTLVPEFNKKYPNVHVTFDGVPYTELLAKMMLDATSPDPDYDVLLVDDPWVPQLAEIGALMDLKGEKIVALTDKDYDWGDFNAAPLAAGEWKDIQYAVPVRSNMLLRFYNRSLYEQAGLPEPTPAQTWDEFFSDAEKLVRDTNADGKDDVWAIDTYFVRESLTPTIWQSILNANGGQLLDESGRLPSPMKPDKSHWKHTSVLSTMRHPVRWGTVFLNRCRHFVRASLPICSTGAASTSLRPSTRSQRH